jgi:uncharacterized Fe-S cluster protein YjdI
VKYTNNVIEILFFYSNNNNFMSQEKVIREYSNGEITVTWLPDECIHATVCFRQLPNVFKPRERPWVKINAASTSEIIKTVDACPTNALTWRYNEVKPNSNNKEMENKETKKPEIKLMENGPIVVPAEIDLKDAQGNLLKENEKKYLCRCGHSKNKPFCDGSHVSSGFKA